jgi:predicted nucleic acid-binding protein
MKLAVFADTGPLYAAIDRSDQYHHRAQSELAKIAKDQLDILIAFPTVFEAHALILRRLGKRVSFDWLADLRKGFTLVAPTLEDYREAHEKLLEYPDQAITLFDALVAVLASRANILVWTYDHHFDVMRTRVWR